MNNFTQDKKLRLINQSNLEMSIWYEDDCLNVCYEKNLDEGPESLKGRYGRIISSDRKPLEIPNNIKRLVNCGKFATFIWFEGNDLIITPNQKDMKIGALKLYEEAAVPFEEIPDLRVFVNPKCKELLDAETAGN